MTSLTRRSAVVGGATMLAMAVPMWVFYELAIIVGRSMGR